MSDLTAVDILLAPDESMLALAHRVNARMLASVPSPPGFALDQHHQPHITTLQRYVNTVDLEKVFAAIEEVVDSIDMSGLTLTAHAIAHMDMQPGIGLSAIVVRPGKEVLDFQARLIEALQPYTGTGGTADAYVRTAAEPEINDTTLNYVENYVRDHSADNYVAHVTVGLATLDDLTTIEAEPFAPVQFSAGGVDIYQLGNNGTAAKKLKGWSA